MSQMASGAVFAGQVPIIVVGIIVQPVERVVLPAAEQRYEMLVWLPGAAHPEPMHNQRSNVDQPEDTDVWSYTPNKTVFGVYRSHGIIEWFFKEVDASIECEPPGGSSFPGAASQVPNVQSTLPPATLTLFERFRRALSVLLGVDR